MNDPITAKQHIQKALHEENKTERGTLPIF